MALVKCKECGHVISTLAQTCPNCGAPGPKTALTQDQPGKVVEKPPAPAARSTRERPLLRPGEQAEERARLLTLKARPRRTGLTILVWTAIALLLITITIVFVMLDKEAAGRDGPAQQGTLQWPNYQTDRVAVYGEGHQKAAVDYEEAQKWEDHGEACLAEPGAKAQVESGRHPLWTTVFVKVMSGRCTGFRGWVPSTVWHIASP